MLNKANLTRYDREDIVAFETPVELNWNMQD
jgi:hypothetical protein